MNARALGCHSNVTALEIRRWRLVDLLDRHAVLQAAYSHINITADGAAHPVWRHSRSANHGSDREAP
ncbi:MAG: hypothetical protein ACRDT8_15300 [Micromonosporaceae bacterium]